MTSEEAWKPIEIVKRKVLPQQAPGVSGIPHVTLAFTLSAAPDNAWATFFCDAPSGRVGSGAFIQAPRPALSGDVITWTVPERDMEGAWKSVKADVDQANARYPGHLQQLREAANEAEDRAVTAQASLDELQRRLDFLE